MPNLYLIFCSKNFHCIRLGILKLKTFEIKFHLLSEVMLLVSIYLYAGVPVKCSLYFFLHIIIC